MVEDTIGEDDHDIDGVDGSRVFSRSSAFASP
jgi:hypothetical protein